MVGISVTIRVRAIGIGAIGDRWRGRTIAGILSGATNGEHHQAQQHHQGKKFLHLTNLPFL
jgi:hypothetical protein